MSGNYDITRDRVQALFPQYDHAAIAKRFHLRLTPEALYVRYFGKEIRINRADGCMTCDGIQQDFDTVLTVMDVLCDAKSDAVLSGRYCTVNNLKGVLASTSLGSNMNVRSAKEFDRDPEGLARALEALGGIRLKNADVAYQINIFDFLPMRVQFWCGDDEFDPVLKFLFDENVLSFMRYETTYYAVGTLLDRLTALMA